MTKIKTQLHKVIDSINDDEILEGLFNVLNDYQEHYKRKGDIVDELSSQQKKRLKQSVNQSKNGQVISDTKMRKEIKKWLAK